MQGRQQTTPPVRSLVSQEGALQALPFPVRITVMGGGNFGLALSLVLARNQVRNVVWFRDLRRVVIVGDVFWFGLAVVPE